MLLQRWRHRQAEILLFSFVGAALCPAAAQEFTELAIDAGFHVTHPVQFARLGEPDDHHVIVAGRDADLNPRLAIFRIDDIGTAHVQRIADVPLDSRKLAYDVARFARHDALVLIEPGRIVTFAVESGEFVELIEVESLYKQERIDELVPVDFFRDLNDDELDDLLIADAAGYRVRLQNEDGSLGPASLLRESVAMSIGGGSVHFQNRPFVSGDMNFDGLHDITVWHGRTLQAYLQGKDGRFSETAIESDTNLDVLTDLELRLLENDRGAVDQEGLTEKRIERIEDLNGDQIPDILTESIHSEGLFDKQNEFRLHLGRAGEDFVAYETSRDALLASEGLFFDPISTDIDGDGRQDLIIRKARLSFARIIRALISGGVSLELQFYRMTGSDSYPEEANYSTKTKVRFSRSSGQVDIPAFEVADFDGDGLQDLVLQSGGDELGYYHGIASDRLFDSLTTKIDVELPRNGELVDAVDANNDGRIDLVMRYSVADSDELSQSVRLLIYAAD